ncbi:hypothetical protein ONS95_003088 [Cadophora gregata]|uniref:uncharacterized protein n=1 Tax=Cadophora gregata TaxID=51156 RepID=UPI0026DCF229|nr:uncharacterized protein ONS95_003088 [Cadophora gregata]KAK0108270.1 hypothetical protein ONS95_003088 [Cadophora gregata]KAK0109139.1 hypothetical protein ONS96_002964 [Cadophora gregata f. sp. sojae]
MEPQPNFLRHDTFFGQGSFENFSVNQDQLGGLDMNRHLSSQSNNTATSGTSVCTDLTEYSTHSWDPMTDSELEPELKYENMYDYTSSMGYTKEDQFGGNGEPSPLTEQANKFEHMSLEYQHSSSRIFPDIQRSNALSIPRDYNQSFSRRSITPEKLDSYGMNNQRSQPTARTSGYGSSLSVYRPAPVPSNSHNGYASSQSGDGPTPSSLGWKPETDLVKKYDLVLINKNNIYLEINKDSEVTRETPARVYLEPVLSSQKGEAHCPWPGKCDRRGEPFGRQADLERHLKNVHGSPARRDKYCCPYNPCLNGRHLKKNSFTRKDHLRDHVRDFHQEDIGAAKGEKNARTKEEKRQWQKEQEKWIASRKITATHWTCAKCVVRMSVEEHGWHCMECNQACEQERMEMRLRLTPPREEAQAELQNSRGLVREDQEQQEGYLQCQTCSGIEWVDNGYGAWDPCPLCNYQETRIGAHCFQ